MNEEELRVCLAVTTKAIDRLMDRSRRVEDALLGKAIASNLPPQDRIDLALSILHSDTEI